VLIIKYSKNHTDLIIYFSAVGGMLHPTTKMNFHMIQNKKSYKNILHFYFSSHILGAQRNAKESEGGYKEMSSILADQ
jgi:hypothetical protein